MYGGVEALREVVGHGSRSIVVTEEIASGYSDTPRRLWEYSGTTFSLVRPPFTTRSRPTCREFVRMARLLDEADTLPW